MARSRKTCQHPYMTAMNIFTVPNLGRGHCLFASLADQVYGTHDKHPQMRKDIVQYIRNHPEEFFEWIDVQEELDTGRGKRSTRKNQGKKRKDGEEEFKNDEDERTTDHFTALNNRLDRMEGREWGDEIEIAAFCQAFDYDVVLFTPTGLRILSNPKHEVELTRRKIHIAYGGEERYPHYESIRKFDHGARDADSQTNGSSSPESSHFTESSLTSTDKSVLDITTKVVDRIEQPSGSSTYTPKDVKTIDVFDLSRQVLTRKDIRELLEDAAQKVNFTLSELIKRDRERSHSSRSSSNETTSSGKRSRQADDDGDEYRPAKRLGRRRSSRLRIKLRVGPDPNASPIQTPPIDTNPKFNGTAPDHRSPLSQSQSTDDVRTEDPSQQHDTKSPITVDARA